MNMHRPGRRAALLAAALSLLVLAVGVQSAAAIGYCNIQVNPFSSCSSTTPNVLLTYNEAAYSGAGSISVCQKVQYGGTLIDRTCGRDHAYMSGFIPLNNYTGYVGNDSQWLHTINGAYSYYGARSAGPSSASGRAETPPAAAQQKLSVLRTSSSGAVTTISRPNDRVSLTPTGDRLCLESTLSAGGSCQTYSKAVEGGLLMTGVCAPRLPTNQVGVYGVVPDGASTVNAVSEDGSTLASAVVAANTFAFQLSKVDAAAIDRFETVGVDGTIQSLGNVLPSDLGC